MRCALMVTGGLIMLCGCSGVAQVIWEDEFKSAARYEMLGVRGWTIGDGDCLFKPGGAEMRLVAPTRAFGEGRIEVDMALDRRVGGGWTFAGLCLYADANNHWQLLLVEGPQGDRYFELIERLDGEHQAQTGASSPRLRLESQDSGQMLTWEYGQTYHLVLTIHEREISGRITHAGGDYWQRTFFFGDARALKRGRAGLVAHGVNGVFRRLRVEAAPAGARRPVTLQVGDAGAVAVLRDEGDRVTGPLARALEQSGFGVTLVDWEHIDEGVLAWERLGALVLADARRVPVGARNALEEALHGGGRVLAIGAPALSELLVHTPAGWRGKSDWANAFAESLTRVPIRLGPDQWSRTAMDLTQEASIEPDPTQGTDTWRISADLKGWDGFSAPVEGIFTEGRELLVFDARGDENTDGMIVECVEKDQSRWIATVKLTPNWQTIVLRAVDFPYWQDSPAKGRGGPGDRLRMGNVQRLSIGLAASHQPHIRPGPHTYWVRGLSSAADPGLPEPRFDVPNVETLCPSYKLYPLQGTRWLNWPGHEGLRPALPWSEPGYSPVWREQGRGFNRGRAWRWIPLVNAYGDGGRKLGALVSLMVGDGSCPNAVWGNVAVADPEQVLNPSMMEEVVRAVRRMTCGAFLLEGGAELFSYKPGETITLGARAVNTGREEKRVLLEVRVSDNQGMDVFSRQEQVIIPPGRTGEARWQWTPTDIPADGLWVWTLLREPVECMDEIRHRIDRLRTEPARPEELVRVQGSHFMLNGKEWFFQGINYWPSWMAGYPTLDLRSRGCYDPEIIERDLTWLESVGVNALSAVAATVPPDPEDPMGYRDQLDFLQRCDQHGMKVHFTVHGGRAYAGGDAEKIKLYLTRAGLRDHPAILAWELAWEPIEVAWQGRLEFMRDDWNRWVTERYGSVENAVGDWGFDPRGAAEGALPVPTVEQCNAHGPWDRYVAAFRRAFSDLISAKYRDIVQPLRAWDPNHLISFRGGACGIPERAAFAHIHSVGVAKHMDYLCPEGYNLQTAGWGKPTPPGDLRRGGLVTLYYRFISREKPVVWMEFGYTVNGFGTPWEPGRVHVRPEKLQEQKTEYVNFYAMMIESGARGAAPWWLPGGFRLGENSDFGIIEPDGSERPVCEVFRAFQPRFADVQHRPPTRFIELDLDRHYPDAWDTYAPQYLEAVQSGETPGLRTAGTGTNSATCPLTAVGGGEYNGHNPPQFLNAEFNRLELKVGQEAWQPVVGGERLEVPRGARVLCRASVGNLGEAAWLAPAAAESTGCVYLAGREEYGLAFQAPISADTPFLQDAEVPEFELLPAGAEALAAGPLTVSFEMTALGRAFFGERRTVTLVSAG